jgi:predicted nucleic acid-binding protein
VAAYSAEDYLKIFWLDTSALVKIFIDEPGSLELRTIFEGKLGHVFFTTDFCKYEFFNVLKRKLMVDECISLSDYFKHIRVLSNYVRSGKIRIDDSDHETGDMYRRTVRLSTEYKLDWTDAIQFTLLQEGGLNVFKGGKSETILVTSDRPMIKAAKGENARFWNPEEGDFTE